MKQLVLAASAILAGCASPVTFVTPGKPESIIEFVAATPSANQRTILLYGKAENCTEGGVIDWFGSNPNPAPIKFETGRRLAFSYKFVESHFAGSAIQSKVCSGIYEFTPMAEKYSILIGKDSQGCAAVVLQHEKDGAKSPVKLIERQLDQNFFSSHPSCKPLQ